MMNLPWVEKYTPSSLKDFLGESAKELHKQVLSWKRGKAILLLGRSGTGKSSSVHALAKDMSWDIIEVNASDSRNADSLTRIVGAAGSQRSLFSSGKLILIDDIDGIAGREDRGGVQALAKLIAESSFPIIITANDVSDPKFKTIRQKCAVIDYVNLSLLDTVAFLKRVADKERMHVDEDALRHLARIADGDLRAAVNDLQSISYLSKVTREDVSRLGFRERKELVGQALLKVFKTKDPGIALQSFDNLDEDLDELFLWLEENIPVEYTKADDISRAFDAVSVGDVFRGRIRRWQYYRFQVYCYALLSAGVALAKREKYAEAHEYRQSGRILKIWIANQKNLKRKAIAGKIASHTHTSSRRVIQDVLPFMKAAAKNKRFANELSSYLRLDEEETEWLVK
jgi:replication factor C large subunit